MLTRLLVMFPLFVMAAFAAWILPFWAGLLALVFAIFSAVVLNLYPDKFLLHFLQARETSETEFPLAHQVAGNQAFKLRIPAPQIFTYNGFFHRAFAFAVGKRSVFVVEKKVLNNVNKEELEALWFALALQVKENSATRSTFALLGMAVWWMPYLKLVSLWRTPPPVMGWIGQFMVAPVATQLHRLGINQLSCQRFLRRLAEYPHEEARLRELNERFQQPRLHLSVESDFTYRASAASHGPREQMILAIEAATHPLDYLRPASQESTNA